MAFTRKYLSGLGIEPDKIEAIMEAHVEVVNGLKEKISEAGDSAEEFAKVKAELEQARNDLKTAQATIKAAEKDDYKTKYETEKAAHEKLMSDISAKETARKKESALTAAAKAAKFSDDAISAILDSRQDYAGKIEFDEEGKVTNADAIIETIRKERPQFAPKEQQILHSPASPPADTGGKKKVTWEDIDKIKDTAERQKVMLENMEQLGLK